jgi:hypothetical protein
MCPKENSGQFPNVHKAQNHAYLCFPPGLLGQNLALVM